MGETLDAIRWMWNAFLDKDGNTYFRRACIWTVAGEMAKLTQPWLLGYGILGLFVKDAQAALTAFAATIALQAISVLFQWQAARNRELLIGQNIRMLEYTINRRFFEKELGLHIERNDILCQSSMEKGRERAERVFHSIAFTGIEVAITLAATFLILCFLKPVAGAIILVVLLVSLGISFLLNNEVMTKAEPVEQEYRAIIRHRNERWNAAERVITNGKEDEEVNEMDRRFDHMLNRKDGDRSVWLGYIDKTPIRELTNVAGFAAVSFYVGWQVYFDVATQAELVSVTAWSVAVTTQVRNFARLERDIGFCIPAIKRMREALDLPKLVKDDAQAIELPNAPVEVTLDGINHGYRGKANVLTDVTFTLGRGESVALIGRSGCGKSTITRLMQRYFDPSGGRVLVNGIDLRRVKLSSWKRLVAYIPQKPQIMDGTLRDNLLYGLTPEERRLWSDERLWAFARRFRVDFGAARLDKGMDTAVGKHGVELSGGEAQRVMIASAAMRGAQFYIIDEATSSLDAEVQAEVQDALYELLKGGASALIIAHRLSTLMRCDKFIVMQPAAVAAEQGVPQVEAVARSTEELALLSPTFRRLAAREGITVAA
ncbi:MAG: ABC transporter ATP-binding protein/permease [Candidatus Uhrbacteria bacterium]|nr:ABC transporter ATP-binding protein/permease [Candidatus Uhrbacteria bacterium]